MLVRWFLAAGAVAIAHSSERLAPFSAIEVRDGGHVVVRHGDSYQATLVRGSRECTTFTVSDGVLVIDDRLHGCRVTNPLDVEVITPSVRRVSYSNGGWVRVASGFPPQQGLDVSVSNGGAVDVRAMSADRVVASVLQGGRIYTVPSASLQARVESGGAITYWGSVTVTSSTEDGGVVRKGEAKDLRLPLSQLIGIQ